MKDNRTLAIFIEMLLLLMGNRVDVSELQLEGAGTIGMSVTQEVSEAAIKLQHLLR